MYFGTGERRHRLHVGRIDLGFVEADGVVAELLRDRVALAADHRRAVHLHFHEQVAEGQLVLGQRLEQALLDRARHVDRVDHHHVPIARLGLLDDRHPRAGAFEFLDVDLDAIGLLERLQQRGIGVVAPDQGVELLSGGGACPCGGEDDGGKNASVRFHRGNRPLKQLWMSRLMAGT